MPARNDDFYQRLRRTLRDWIRKDGRNHKWAEYVLLAPDLFHLLCRLTIDRDVPPSEKAKLAVAIVYFVSPIDLVPEAVLGPAGYVDDVALAAYVLNSVLEATDEDVLRRHWAGDGDVLLVVQHILDVAEEMVGQGVWARLVAIVEGLKKRRGPGRPRRGPRKPRKGR